MVVEMQVGDVIAAGDLTLPEGAKLLGSRETVICSLTVMAEEVEEAPAEEAPAEPEVIGEEKPQEPGAPPETG